MDSCEPAQDVRGRAKHKKNKCWRTAGISLLGGICILCIVLFSVFGQKASTPGVVPPTPPCSSGWHQNEEKCYYFSDTEANWNDSQKNCSSLGGSLVTMETQQEMDFVLRSKNHIYIWIGLRRENVGQPWRTPNGSIFINWLHIRGQGWCAYLNEEKVSSTECTNFQFWICSKPAVRTFQKSEW